MIELLLEAERSLSVGMLDHAERLYRQAAEHDPRNSIAVVGLARVALERGDETGAIELGQRALEIDPENVAARRLVDRLIEVRRERGLGGYIMPAPGRPAPAASPGGETDVPATRPRRGFLRRILRRG